VTVYYKFITTRYDDRNKGKNNYANALTIYTS